MATHIIENMAVEIEGEGAPVVMLHGLGGTSNTFQPQVGSLAGRYRLIRPDLPGSGRSAVPASLSIPEMAERVARMMGVLNLGNAHLVGHSMGTIVCQHVAARTPQRARSLFLCGPLIEPPEPARAGLRARAEQARRDGMAPIADAIVQGSTANATKERLPVALAAVRESLMRQDARGYALTCEALAAAEAADLQAIRCPTLLMAGEEDAVAPPSVARTLAERIRGARAQILPRCGHWTTFEQAEEVNRALAAFLTGIR